MSLGSNLTRKALIAILALAITACSQNQRPADTSKAPYPLAAYRLIWGTEELEFEAPDANKVLQAWPLAKLSLLAKCQARPRTLRAAEMYCAGVRRGNQPFQMLGSETHAEIPIPQEDRRGPGRHVYGARGRRGAALGIRVLAISCMTNLAAGLSDRPRHPRRGARDRRARAEGIRGAVDCDHSSHRCIDGIREGRMRVHLEIQSSRELHLPRSEQKAAGAGGLQEAGVGHEASTESSRDSGAAVRTGSREIERTRVYRQHVLMVEQVEGIHAEV